MASMTIRNIDDGLKSRLRVRAAEHNRSMEDEARDILRTALSTAPAQACNLAESIRGRVGPAEYVELELAPRAPVRTPPELS